MMQNGSSASEAHWRTRRRYPRVPIDAPVEIYTQSTVGPPVIGRIDSLSVGGALASCRESFDLHTELAMLFQLPSGFRVQAFGKVRYATPGRHFGVAFVDLDREGQLQLEEFTQKMLGYARRSNRVPYRTHLTVRLSEGDTQAEESAETVLVSKNGGLFVCRSNYKEGQDIFLYSPERKSGARARVVFQHVWATGSLVEVGFEFLGEEDFWNIDFTREYD
ncbi:MAG: PilZ domain-containing protein [Terriglobales bacterium]